MLLSHASVAQPAAKTDYKPTKAGGGGALRTLFWQAPTLLNPHFAVGNKDQEGSRVFYEPLAGWDAEGNLVPVLAAELPEIENGGIAPDGMSVTWKLKKGVQWRRAPFTAMTGVQGNTPPTRRRPRRRSATIRTSSRSKLDLLTVRVASKPMPFWAQAFVGSGGISFNICSTPTGAAPGATRRPVEAGQLRALSVR
jgi:peptide/nickel transport system substrate-binding protein